MPVVTLTDVRGALAVVEISSTSQPSEAQVESMVEEVETEVRSYAEQRHVPWPVDPTSVPYKWLKATILEGVKMKVLAAKYALSPQLPDSVRLARNNYNDRLRRVQYNLVPSAFYEDSAAGGPHYSGPLVGSADSTALTGETLAQYTTRRRRDAGTTTPGYPT